jgi:hypothetical protein
MCSTRRFLFSFFFFFFFVFSGANIFKTPSSPTGKYSANPNTITCTDAPIGTSQPNTGQTGFVDCTAGYYQAT